MPTLADVKAALNITGDYQDATLRIYMDDVEGFLNEAGVKSENISAGLMARGVADLWNYGAGDGRLSTYFRQRAAQLALK